MEKEVLSLMLLCVFRQTLKKLSGPDFPITVAQTLFLIFSFFFWTVYLLLALDPLPGFLSIGYGNQSTGKLVILFPKPAIDLFSDLRDSRESLSLKPSFVTRGESDWLLFLRSLHMRQRSKWARFCKASKGQTDNKKTQLGPELARG